MDDLVPPHLERMRDAPLYNPTNDLQPVVLFNA